jgi:uncharacterized protein (DUF1330 family)
VTRFRSPFVISEVDDVTSRVRMCRSYAATLRPLLGTQAIHVTAGSLLATEAGTISSDADAHPRWSRARPDILVFVPVNPTARDLARLLDERPDGPFVMLNLLKFARYGRAGYEAYARQARGFLERYGAEVVYAGDCSTVLVAPEDHAWDALLLVRYPSRQAFSEMVADPDYRSITELRTAALEDTVLQATIPWG